MKQITLALVAAALALTCPVQAAGAQAEDATGGGSLGLSLLCSISAFF